jgi:chromosome segregation ATPase
METKNFLYRLKRRLPFIGHLYRSRDAARAALQDARREKALSPAQKQALAEAQQAVARLNDAGDARTVALSQRDIAVQAHETASRNFNLLREKYAASLAQREAVRSAHQKTLADLALFRAKYNDCRDRLTEVVSQRDAARQAQQKALQDLGVLRRKFDQARMRMTEVLSQRDAAAQARQKAMGNMKVFREKYLEYRERVLALLAPRNGTDPERNEAADLQLAAFEAAPRLPPSPTPAGGDEVEKRLLGVDLTLQFLRAEISRLPPGDAKDATSRFALRRRNERLSQLEKAERLGAELRGKSKVATGA